MFLRKSTAGAAPGYTWHAAGDVVEVPDWLGEDLLAIPGGGFTEVEAPEMEPEAVPEPDEPGLTRGQKAAATRAANKAAAEAAAASETAAEDEEEERAADAAQAAVEAPETGE